MVYVHRTVDRCTVLGPGLRAVIWVQGCPLRCPGCLAPETLPTGTGAQRSATELADWLASLTDVEGVTFSGGEPFAQADELARVLDEVRAIRPHFTAMSYSGFRLETLRRGTPGQRAFLERLDLLIDGPYQAAKHANLRWRGSANQRLIPLTPRYRELLAEPDTGQGIEFTLGLDGTFSWAGVPATPNFRERIEAGIAARGYEVRPAAVPGAGPPGTDAAAASRPGQLKTGE